MVDDTQSATVTRPQIRIQNAVKSFNGRVVVDVEDLTLGDHPIEGLIGPNGAGKTTLMRMIMHSTKLDQGTVTFIDPDAGTVTVGNTSLEGLVEGLTSSTTSLNFETPGIDVQMDEQIAAI